MFTITTPPEQEAAAHALVLHMSPGARLTYALSGTRKYELPMEEVTLPGEHLLLLPSAADGAVAIHVCISINHTALNLLSCCRAAHHSAGVFDTMAAAKSEVTVLDWGIANATLEEVFIKFSKSIGVTV